MASPQFTPRLVDCVLTLQRRISVHSAIMDLIFEILMEEEKLPEEKQILAMMNASQELYQAVDALLEQLGHP